MINMVLCLTSSRLLLPFRIVIEHAFLAASKMHSFILLIWSMNQRLDKLVPIMHGWPR